MIKVFKFGGASVKSAEAVRNLADIISEYGSDKIMLIISAMGKTTNALEKLLHAIIDDSPTKEIVFNEIKDFHFSIIDKLFTDRDNVVFSAVNFEFNELNTIINSEIEDKLKSYAQVISFGEVLSTLIVGQYLKEVNVNVSWRSAEEYIITENKYQEAKVIWDKSSRNIKNKLLPLFNEYDCIITQGFVAGAENGSVSTLGREGSDYSASIFAFCLDASSLTIWKDVPGLLNADPKYFEDTQKIKHISYRETIELAYYGASIIHPKTIKPLQNKSIPLFIKSFLKPDEDGTIVRSKTYSDSLIPSYIFKKNQVLLSISARDFSFIDEQSLSMIFNKLDKFGLRVNMMQNSAISFSLCMDNKNEALRYFVDDMKESFKVKYNENMELITIQHYNQEIIDNLIADRDVFLEQKNRTTVQLLVR